MFVRVPRVCARVPVYMCVWMHVCMHACVCVCVHAWPNVCQPACVYACMCRRVARVYVCMYLCVRCRLWLIQMRLWLCNRVVTPRLMIRVCTHAYRHACSYVCGSVCMCAHVCEWLHARIPICCVVSSGLMHVLCVPLHLCVYACLQGCVPACMDGVYLCASCLHSFTYDTLPAHHGRSCMNPCLHDAL